MECTQPVELALKKAAGRPLGIVDQLGMPCSPAADSEDGRQGWEPRSSRVRRAVKVKSVEGRWRVSAAENDGGHH